jgi:hypothetical protein
MSELELEMAVVGEGSNMRQFVDAYFDTTELPVVVDGKKEREKGGGQCRRKREKICGIYVILYTRVVCLFCLF